MSGEEINDDTDVSAAVILLHKIAEAFKEDGGFEIPANMPTDEAITDFGIQIAALAGALVAFEEAGKGLGEGTDKALATLDFFTELKNKLLTMEGFGTDLSTSINAFKDETEKWLRQMF